MCMCVCVCVTQGSCEIWAYMNEAWQGGSKCAGHQELMCSAGLEGVLSQQTDARLLEGLRGAGFQLQVASWAGVAWGQQAGKGPGP